MRKRWNELLFVIFLGCVIPAIAFSLFKNDGAEQSKQQESSMQSLDAVNPNEPIRISVLTSDDAIRIMDLDDYLTGVVLCEMPIDFDIEALKAQAVVARTYTLRRYNSGGKHNNAAVCTDPSCCQGFTDIQDYMASGSSADSIDKIRQAVELTENQVLVYNGDLIEATYFSCSGGMTEDAAAVWGSDIPYLRATASPGEEIATHYTDTVIFSAAEFQRLLGVKLIGKPGSWIGSVTYTNGGGIATMEIGGTMYKGTTLRQRLGLRSTAFVITAVGDTVTITTKGFGHRVGMSQYGAEAMAVNGKTYENILAHYYAGAKLAPYKGEVIDKG